MYILLCKAPNTGCGKTFSLVLTWQYTVVYNRRMVEIESIYVGGREFYVTISFSYKHIGDKLATRVCCGKLFS